MTIRTDWNHNWGPLDLPLPIDPIPHPGVDWKAVWDNYLSQEHYDSQDAVRQRVYGTANPAEVGGSGICPAYSTPDLDAVLTIIKCFPNSVPPDNEHLIRWLLFYIQWWELTHDPKAARALVSFVSNRIAAWHMNPDGADYLTFFTNEVIANPSKGTRMNGREAGWLSYARAMQMKVARTETSWARNMIQLCNDAAILGTGQVLADVREGIDQQKVVYCFHQGILLMGVLALCKRLGWGPPKWTLDWMTSVSLLPTVLYYGTPSMPAFCYSRGIHLVPATGTGQQPDPAFGWYQSCCVALASMGHPEFMQYATKFGPATWDGHDEQVRKSTMLLRGVQP